MIDARALVLAAPTLTPHREPLDATAVRAVIDATADAGFAGLSIWTDHHDWAVADGLSSDAYFGLHRERGLSVPAAEVIVRWAGLDRAGVAAVNSHLLDVAARAGASSVIAVTLDAELPPLREAAAGLAALCDLAADRGLAVSFEFLPFSPVPTIADAARLFEATDRENLGLVLDTWHWFRQPGGPDVATLRGFPADRIHILQLNDAPADPPADIMVETASARLLPGDGDIDILRLLDVLDDMRATPIVVSEVFSAALAGLGPAESARRQHAAAVALLAPRTTSHRAAVYQPDIW